MIDKNILKTSPELIFKLRESAFANDLFITAVSYFNFFIFLKKYRPAGEFVKSLIFIPRPNESGGKGMIQYWNRGVQLA